MKHVSLILIYAGVRVSGTDNVIQLMYDNAIQSMYDNVIQLMNDNVIQLMYDNVIQLMYDNVIQLINGKLKITQRHNNYHLRFCS